MYHVTLKIILTFSLSEKNPKGVAWDGNRRGEPGAQDCLMFFVKLNKY